MKSIYTLTNVFLFIVIAIVADLNTLDDQTFLESFLAFLFFFGFPLAIAVFYGLGHLRNVIIKWFLFVGYLVTGIFLTLGTIELVSDFDFTSYLLFFTIITILAGLGCFINAYYVYRSSAKKIKLNYFSIMNKGDEKFYEMIADELENSTFDRALWTKATALSNGSHDSTKSAYIKLRVKQLKEQNRDRKSKK